MRYLLVAFSLSAAPMLAQALVSNTIAISSGSVAGSYAGKGIQKNTKNIFTKTGDVLDQSSEAGTAPKPGDAIVAPAAKMPPAPEYSPGSKHTGDSARIGTGSRGSKGAPIVVASRKVTNTIPEAAPFLFTLPDVAPPPVKVVSREMLAEIVAGTTREELIARLGLPASRVSIPNSGTLEEIYYYTHAGEILGAVRVIDDSVSRVDINR